MLQYSFLLCPIWVGHFRSMFWYISYLLLITMLFFSARAIMAQNHTFEEFQKMSLSEQKKQIINFFESRINSTKNLKYDVKEILEEYSYKDGVKGKKLPGFRQTIFHHYLLNNSYRLVTEIYLYDRFDRPQIQHQSSFDRREGQMRGIYQEVENQIYGKVDAMQDPAIVYNNFWHWLSDQFSVPDTLQCLPEDSYIFPFMLKHTKYWKINLLPDERMIKLSIPMLPRSDFINFSSRKTLVLDPEKDFMPIRGESYCEEQIIKPNEKKFYSHRSFVVKDSSLIASMWMPTLLVEEVANGPNDDAMSVMTLTLSNYNIGGVTEDDIKVVFPEGIDVVDTIQGVSYKTGANGEPKGDLEPIYNLAPSVLTQTEP